MVKADRILVVDDDLHLLHAASHTLKKAGYEVIEASTGRECLRLLRAHRPDMVLLDVVLPDVDGIEVCRRIKGAMPEIGCFVLMVSGAKTSPDDQADGLEVGADGYITRPISNREYLARVAAMLRIKRAEESVEHLNRVLRAINNVNQLIAREKDRDRMLQGVCDLLIETRGYHNAWIALFDESAAVIATAEAGLDDRFSPLRERLKRGELTACGRRALAQSGVVVIQDPCSTCVDCPLAANYAGRGAMTDRLEHRGKVYGLLTVSIPAHLAALEDEQILLREVAGDIAFALQAINTEEEQKRAEEALRESEERLRQVVENMPVMMDALDENFNVVAWNRECERVTGYSAEEMIGRPRAMDMLYPDAAYRERMMAELTGIGSDFRDREYTIICKDGTEKTISWSNISSSFPIPGWATWAVGVDVTERKRAQRQIEAALREKEVMLKEIHHRVKNNLAIVAGLLEFQAETVEDEDAREAFRASQNRIYTMAHIHEHLYRSSDLARIDMGDYIRSLMSYLQQTYGAYDVDMDVGAGNVSMTVDVAIPCGLIVNELVSNALQHAFPPERCGPGPHRVFVELYELDGQLTLKVSDNGVGLPRDFDRQNLSSLGVKLTDMLVRQLEGDMAWHAEDGATFIITFPTHRGEVSSQ